MKKLTKSGKLLIVYIVPVFILMSCSKNYISESDDTNVKRIELEKIGNMDPSHKIISDYIKEFYCIKLDTTEYLSQINKICYYEDKIFILDRNSNAIFVFSEKGKFILKIFNEGKGPGEYRQIADFTINKTLNTIVIMSQFKHTLISYDFTGELVSEKKLENNFRADFLSYVDSNTYIFNNHYNPLMNKGKKRIKIFYTDSEGSIIRRFITFPKEYLETNLMKTEAFFKSGSNLNYLDFYDEYVYSVDNNKIEKKYFLDFGEHNLLPSMLIKDVPKNPDKYENYILGVDGFYENDSTIAISFTLGNGLKNCYYDKKSEHFIIGEGEIEDDIIFPAWNKFILGNHQGYFISSLSALYLNKYFEQLKEILPEESFKVFLSNNSSLEKIQNISPLDNPVLFFYKFKNF